MARLSDLGYPSITQMTQTEGLSLLLSIRESRFKITPKIVKTTQRRKKELSLSNITPEQAERILQMINKKLSEEQL